MEGIQIKDSKTEELVVVVAADTEEVEVVAEGAEEGAVGAAIVEGEGREVKKGPISMAPIRMKLRPC